MWKRVYSWVEYNQESFWTEALLTRAHINRFLVMSDCSHIISHHLSKEHDASQDKERHVATPLEKEGKLSRRDVKGQLILSLMSLLSNRVS